MLLIIVIIGIIAVLVWDYLSKPKPQPQVESVLYKITGSLLILSTMVLSVQTLGINLFRFNPFGSFPVFSTLISFYVLINGIGAGIKAIKG